MSFCLESRQRGIAVLTEQTVMVLGMGNIGTACVQGGGCGISLIIERRNSGYLYHKLLQFVAGS